MPYIDPEVDAELCQRYGLLTSRRAVELYGKSGARTARRNGQLIDAAPGVLRQVGAPRTFRQRALAVSMAYGPLVAISHESAARLWEVEGFDLAAMHISVPSTRSGRLDVGTTHRVHLSEDEVTSRFGIPVTDPARTFCDLATSQPETRAARALDDLLRIGAISHSDLLRCAEARGSPGSRTIRRIVGRRLSEPSTSTNRHIVRVMGWIERARLPLPVLEHQIVLNGRVLLLDFAWPQRKVCLEFNGWQYHQMRSRADQDHARRSDLLLGGWLTLTITSAHRREQVVSWLRQALDTREATPPDRYRTEPPGKRGMLGR